jgi:predicted negative regulator of RcsB-dependent stress response
MEGLEDEREQLEALKKWWRDNGRSVIVGLVIGFGALVGSRLWVNYTEKMAVAASQEFDQLRTELNDKNFDAVDTRANYIITNFARTPYAVLAALALARVNVEQGDLASARARLQWAQKHADEPELAEIARLRLAQVTFAEGSSAAALDVLGGDDPAAFAGAYQELRGDIYASMGQADKARAAYQAAIQTRPAGLDTHILDMKLDDLAAADAN